MVIHCLLCFFISGVFGLSFAIGFSAAVFKIKRHKFLDTLIQSFFVNIMKIINFQGDLTSISANTNPLVAVASLDDLNTSVHSTRFVRLSL